jgi:hypothetical protein
MMNVTLAVIVLGTVAVALTVDIAALVGWLRRFVRHPNYETRP